MISTFTIKRTGEFTVHTVPGTPHCGTKPVLKIQYSFVCRCLGTSLDSRGFLFDQVNVDKYFQSIRACDISCERLAMRCTRDLLRMILKENKVANIRHVSLTLSPEPFAAGVTYELNAK